MHQLIQQVRKELMENADQKYQEFNQSLVPGTRSPMLGVRMPVLRKIAKDLAKSNGLEYIEAMVQMEREGVAYHEELLLHGMLIGYLKCENSARAALLDVFIPVINNWAVCDSSCMTYKFMKKDMEYWFSYLMKVVKSDQEYSIRFAVVTMLDHFVTDEYVVKILEEVDRVRHEGYYVKMAVAWAVSVCYVKFPELTHTYLEKDHLDDFTHNKSIQKIRESYRVSQERKDILKTMKR